MPDYQLIAIAINNIDGATLLSLSIINLYTISI